MLLKPPASLGEMTSQSSQSESPSSLATPRTTFHPPALLAKTSSSCPPLSAPPTAGCGAARSAGPQHGYHPGLAPRSTAGTGRRGGTRGREAPQGGCCCSSLGGEGGRVGGLGSLPPALLPVHRSVADTGQEAGVPPLLWPDAGPPWDPHVAPPTGGLDRNQGAGTNPPAEQKRRGIGAAQVPWGNGTAQEGWREGSIRDR